MYYDLHNVSVGYFTALLEKKGVVGLRRHLMLELFFVFDVRDWERPHESVHFSDLLDIPEDQMHHLLQSMVEEDLIECSKNMKTGDISNIALSASIFDTLRSDLKVIHDRESAVRAGYRTPRPASDGLKRRTLELFDYTCEICGDKAALGKDRYGKPMRVSRIDKDADASPENVTLLCSKCSTEHTRRDLPAECRTTRMLMISEEKNLEFAPRTASAAPRPIKEIVLTATGPISVKTRNISSVESDDD